MKTVYLFVKVLETRKPTEKAERVIIREREIKSAHYLPFDIPRPSEDIDGGVLHALTLYYAGSIALQIGCCEDMPVFLTDNNNSGEVVIWYYGDRKGDRMTRVIVTGYDISR